MNTIATSTRRAPRAVLIGIVVLTTAFVALMLVRSGVVGGSSTDSISIALPTQPNPATPSKPATPAKPRVVLLPNLPAQIAAKLRYSNVVVVSLYTGTSAADRSAVTEARAGASAASAGFASINVLDEASARSLTRFGGPTDSPAVLIVRRPGKIVSEFTGPVEGKVVAQAARNAGAGR